MNSSTLDPKATDSQAFRPFEGLTVIDLSSILAGPAVGTFFAELGASVTKIENPRTGGDATRSWKLSSEDADSPVSAYFASVNHQKQYVSIDLSTEAGINQVYRLISKADIVLMNYKLGDEFKFGLDYQRLRLIKPDIILAHLTGFENDPERTAFDVVLQAETGFMSMNGTPDSGPVKMPVALIDVLAAHQMKEAILVALLLRHRTGRGSHIRCSLEASALTSLINQAANYLMVGHIPGPIGTLHPNIAPYGEMFTCADGPQIVLAVGSNRQFLALCQVLDLNDLPVDTRFATNTVRVTHRTELARLLSKKITKYTAELLLSDLTKARVPAGIVRNLDQVLSGPVAQSLIRTELIEGIQTKRLTSVAWQMTP
jgi:crotonobetainyl-CoA:carnitine CoA-transferase CaiB-like acyl-CoA transferase